MLVCHVNKEDKKIFQKLCATTFVCVFALVFGLAKRRIMDMPMQACLLAVLEEPAACSGMVVMICVG